MGQAKLKQLIIRTNLTEKGDIMTDETKNLTIEEELTMALTEFSQETEPAEPKLVVMLDETHLQINGVDYSLVSNHKDAFQVDALNGRYNEVLNKYDYIVGDWGYDQLRLKGFYKNSSNFGGQDKKIQFLQDYLYEYCNFGCAYFVIQREGDPIPEPSLSKKSRQRQQHSVQKATAQQVRPHQNQENKRQKNKANQPQKHKKTTKSAPEVEHHKKTANAAKQFAIKENHEEKVSVKTHRKVPASKKKGQIQKPDIKKDPKKRFEIRQTND